MTEAAATSRGLLPFRRPLAGLSLIVTYALFVLALVVPTFIQRNDPVVRSPFAQRWNLFAPNPPSANLYTFLIVRYWDGSGTRTTEPADLSTAVRENSREQWWASPKLVRVVTRINVAFERYAYNAARTLIARGAAPGSLPHGLVRTIERQRSQQLDAYRRLLSAAAPLTVPEDARIVAVRGILLRSPVISFEGRGRRHVTPNPIIRDADEPVALVSQDVVYDVRSRRAPRPMLIFDSGWMPFAADVERMRLRL